VADQQKRGALRPADCSFALPYGCAARLSLLMSASGPNADIAPSHLMLVGTIFSRAAVWKRDKRPTNSGRFFLITEVFGLDHSLARAHRRAGFT
jgi:hypothetical protein